MPVLLIRAPNFVSAMNELIRQMKVEGQTVQKCNVSATPTAQAGNTGTGVVFLSTKRGDGLVQENLIQETALCICTQDSYTGNAIAGQEQFLFVGVPQTGNTWDWDWPQGSSAQLQLNAVSASQYANPTGNLLVNGDFLNWSGGSLSRGWKLTTGTYGVDVQQSATSLSGEPGTFALQINPTNVPVCLLQPFGSAAGTSQALTNEMAYAVNVWMRSSLPAVGSPYGLLLCLTQSGQPITGGVITVSLVDQGGQVVNDTQGNPNTFTINASAVSLNGVYQAFSRSFRAPEINPAQMQLSIQETTPIVGAPVVIDNVCFTPLQPTYQGGPGIAVFSGGTNFLLNDAYNCQMNNDRGGSLYCSSFQPLFDRLFGMKALGLLLPSSSSPTIFDTLITSNNGSPVGLLLSLTRP